VLSPAAPAPHVLLAFNAPSLAKFGPLVVDGGIALYDRSVIPERPALRAGVRTVAVDAAGIAKDLGRPMVKNIVALGALAAATRVFPAETFLTAIRHALHGKPALIDVNEQAFRLGMQSVNGG
jgi:2-oxoisovalerate ferredoxin oxidoreductase beta subunit